MTDGILGPVVEDEVSQVRVGVKTTKIDLAEIHQDLVGALAVAGILSVVGFADRIGKGIVRVRARQHLFHLKLRSRTASDDRLGPLFDRLTLLAPVVLRGIPKAPFLQSQGDQLQRCGIQPS